MASPGTPGGEPPGPPQQVIAARRQQRIVAALQIRRRRRVLAPIGLGASGPLEQSVSPRVVLQSDFDNIVEEPSAGFEEVEITRDADGKMHFWSRFS